MQIDPPKDFKNVSHLELLARRYAAAMRLADKARTMGSEPSAKKRMMAEAARTELLYFAKENF